MTPDVNEIVEDLKNMAMVRWRKRRLWKPFMEKYDCQFICEIGVREAANFGRMIAHNPKMAVAVDAWVDDGNPAHNDAGYAQEHQDMLYQRIRDSFMDNPAVHICREYSHEAASHFPDEFFDLIYIDADHTYEGCKRDLETWYPKLKPGKFLTGDDYTEHRTPVTGVRFGVVRAVNEFGKEHGYEIHEMPARGWAIIKR